MILSVWSGVKGANENPRTKKDSATFVKRIKAAAVVGEEAERNHQKSPRAGGASPRLVSPNHKDQRRAGGPRP